MSPESRKLRTEKTKATLPPPSREWAWMLGIISSGGSTSEKVGMISLTGYETNLLAPFQEVGESLFQIPASLTCIYKDQSGRKYLNAHFSSTDLARQIGDLKRNTFPYTIIDRYGWIMTNPDYSWSFIQAMLETSGHIDTGDHKHCIVFNTIYPNVVAFTADLLSSVGILGLATSYNSCMRYGIAGLRISDITDVKRIADHIHSHRPEQEERLAYYRNLVLTPEYLLTLRQVHVPKNEKEIIAEWVRLRTLLQHTPRSDEITKLRRQGKTRFSHTVYSRFGEGKFSKARDYLERITQAGEEEPLSLE